MSGRSALQTKNLGILLALRGVRIVEGFGTGVEGEREEGVGRRKRRG